MSTGCSVSTASAPCSTHPTRFGGCSWPKVGAAGKWKPWCARRGTRVFVWTCTQARARPAGAARHEPGRQTVGGRIYQPPGHRRRTPRFRAGVGRELESRWPSFQEPLIVVLDGIEDPRNLGACLRTAEAAGAAAVMLPRRGSAPRRAPPRRPPAAPWSVCSSSRSRTRPAAAVAPRPGRVVDGRDQ